MHGAVSGVTIGVYVFLILFIAIVLGRSDHPPAVYAVYGLVVLTVFFLARYLSTNYRIDSKYLYARRIVGSRRMLLSEIRKIEQISLRDLSPTGFWGSWGYRGRMWSAHVGAMDAIYTDPSGLLVTGGGVPLFISPTAPDAFARELSRRVRSYVGDIAVDDGRLA